MQLSLYRASILHFDKATQQPEKDVCFYCDGALVVQDKKIIDIGEYEVLSTRFPQSVCIDYRGKLIIPGLIDSHLHFPQTEMIAKYGSQLLDWLENYTFPTEQKFQDAEYCNAIAQRFLAQLINNGTTTAFVYASVHKTSVDALFECASALNMGIVTGKVCMDRHCPDYLQDTPQSAQKDSQALIDKWHENDRNLYALTPRFAPTSSPEQLAALGELAQQYPNVFIQTHLSENHGEIEWVKQLFPKQKSYLDVYDHYHMVHDKSLFGHCLHLHEHEWERLADAGATAVFCPTSNLFLGSGLFCIEKAYDYNVNMSLATDVGAGTSFNMLSTYGEAYKVGQLQHTKFSIFEGLYMMTQGPSSYYGLENEIGNLNPGSYADFIVINPHFDHLSNLRCQSIEASEDAEDLLFALSFIGDDRAVEATYIAGVNVKESLKEQQYAMA
ncbi:MAG: guanine deaminase [Pseudomonadota bacterium]